MPTRQLVITGGAGLVGQNLIGLLESDPDLSITAIDKHAANCRIFRALHDSVRLIESDLAQSGDWESAVAQCDVLVISHAQIGGLKREEFVANNVVATRHVLAAAKRGKQPLVIHISSSVLNSMASDEYIDTKEQQEALVMDSGLDYRIFRPTLMFGPLDRKHLGWLSRMMRRSPVFPVPGSGKFIRQPLYVQDFCHIIAACIKSPPPERCFNISGHEKIHYIDMIRMLKSATNSRCLIIKIPLGLFRFLLQVYALFDRDPPFTAKQLDALVTPDHFEIIDWPEIFQVRATPLKQAFEETYAQPAHAQIKLEF